MGRCKSNAMVCEAKEEEEEEEEPREEEDRRMQNTKRLETRMRGRRKAEGRKIKEGGARAEQRKERGWEERQTVYKPVCPPLGWDAGVARNAKVHPARPSTMR